MSGIDWGLLRARSMSVVSISFWLLSLLAVVVACINGLDLDTYEEPSCPNGTVELEGKCHRFVDGNTVSTTDKVGGQQYLDAKERHDYACVSAFVFAIVACTSAVITKYLWDRYEEDR